MNKRQRKKLCCPKCGNRFEAWIARYSCKDELSCKICALKNRKLMQEIFSELGEISPILGSFMKGSGIFSYGGLL